jgi:hypothetical protein
MEGLMPANSEVVRSLSRVAGADFSGGGVGQYRFCKVSAVDVVVDGVTIPAGCVVLAGAGVRALGVIVGKAPAGEPIEVGIEGRLLVVCGGTVAPGDAVSSDVNSAAITHTSTNQICGIALDGGDAGDIISIQFDRSGQA